MGQWDSVYQPQFDESGLVPVQSKLKRALLPFERDLIAFVGLTEAEYLDFVSEVRHKGVLRPAEYDHIPDIRCDPVITPILVNLAIGIALTGAALLLAPRPNRPEEDGDEVTQRRITSIRGRSRFNQTTGFGSVQVPAELGDTVPIIFGRYAETTPPTGGISTAPTLLWSRMLSYGQHQTFRGIYTLGQRVYDDNASGRPQLPGILIGNNSLDNLSPRKFALYWSSGNDDGNSEDRIVAADLIAGTRAEPSAGDPFTTNDPFVCPTEEGVQAGFCMAVNPSNQTSFGLHSPIRNGSSVRVNWTEIPFWPDDVEDSDRIKMARRKIAGSRADDREDGMKGTGRGYSPKMGVVRFNGSDYQTITEVDASIGDSIDFVILKTSYRDKLGELDFTRSSGVTGDDIQSTTNSFRQAADDVMTEGEIFQIGEALWQVHSRSGVYVPEGESDASDSTIVLKCIEILNGTSTAKVGIAGWEALEQFVTDEGGDDTATEEDFARGWIGQLWYPLMRSDIGMVRSERPSPVVDIGFASTVYTQLNGLANFPALPTPDELERFDNDNVQVTAGTQTLFSNRASFFTVHIRPSGINQSTGGFYSWVPTGKKIGIVGNRPSEQYNFLRFLCTQSPAGKSVYGEFEFRFIGLSMASMARDTEPEDVIDILDAKSKVFFSFSDISAHGYNFQATYRGFQKAFGEFYPLDEFINQGKRGEFKYEDSVKPGSQLTLDTIYPLWIESGKLAAYWYEIFGLADDNKGQTKSYEGKAYKFFTDGQPDRSGPSITYRVTATSQPVWWHQEKYGYDNAWVDYVWEVLDSDGAWEVDDEAFAYERIPTSGNPFTFDWPPPLDGSNDWNGGPLLRVTEIETTGTNIGEFRGRIFEIYSGVANVSFYNEVTLSNDSQAEHRIAYFNQMNANQSDATAQFGHYLDLALMGLVLQSNRQFPNVDQLRVWIPYGVTCYRFRTDDYGPSNLFPEFAYYLLTNKEQGAGTFVNEQLIDKDSFKRSAQFCEANGLTFDGVLTTPQNLRSYLSTLAPSFLCDFEVINGKFGISPALPEKNGTIDAYELPVSGFFGAGNIIDGSFQVSFIPRNERRPVRMSIIYREMPRENLPESRTVTVSYKDATSEQGLDLQFVQLDISDFCSSREHALMVGRYNLAVKRHIDHTISFKTIPTELGLRPGNLIVVQVQSAPYNSFCNGAFNPDDGSCKSVNFLNTDDRNNDGTFDLEVYTPGSGAATETVTISNNVVTEQKYYGKVFAKVPTVAERRYYKISKIELDEEGLVNVDAMYYPTKDLQSTIALDVKTPGLFEVIG